MAVKINLEKKVKFWRFVHHDASSVNIDRMSGDYNQAVQKLIQPRVKVSNDDAIPEEQVSRDYESLYPENYTEVEVAKIRKRAEMIQTVQGMKNLAFDNNILFWFSNHGQQLSDRSLVLNGSRNDGHKLTTPAGANPRSANNFKTFESKGKYFLKIHSGHNPEDEIVEVLFFESREKLEEWRGWLAKVPVCFLDLKHRYEFIQHRGRDGPYRIVDLRSSEMQFELAGRILDCTSAQSIVSSLEEARQECYVLLDMQKYGIAPVFREIHLYGTQVWVITTPVTGVYLSDWFQDYLSKDSHEDTLASRVLQFILALMQSVKTPCMRARMN